MRIAQIAPLYESVPPKYYGGTERIVSYLTEALVALGHEVTLYASGDSVTRARLRAVCAKASRLDPGCSDAMPNHVFMVEKLCQQAEEFDVVHSHVDYLALPLLRRIKRAHATTLHGRLDLASLVNLYREFSDEPLISISHHQQEPLWWANWQDTVYHGLPADLYSFHERRGQYLAFLGRISPEKRPDEAIAIARRAGVPLKMAAKVDKADEQYFNAVVKPLLKASGVEYIGEIGEAEKGDFLGNALALLFPIHWPEPFGLVMIEAMACGTPVVARGCGSVPEVITDGVSGFIFQEPEEAVGAIARLSEISRFRCRQEFEQRFTAARMARDYIQVYERLIERKPLALSNAQRNGKPGLRSRRRLRKKLEPQMHTDEHL